MNRGARLAAWGVVWVALAAGPGCMMFDDCDEECERYSSEYQRERRPQVSEYPASPAAPVNDTTAPGVYNDADRR